MLKKFFCLTLILIAAMTALTVTAGAYEDYTSVKVDELLADKSGWTGQEELTFGESSLTHTFKENQVYTNSNYTFLNGMMTFNLESLPLEDGTKADPYILLRAKETNTVPWKGNDAYLFVLSKTQIELQRWVNKGSEFLAVTENPMPKDGPALIQCGAVNVEDGVQLLLFINGKLVVSCLDKAPGILREQKGYFGFYNYGIQRISAVGDVSADITPIASGFAIEGSGILGQEITSSYNFLDLSGAKEEGTKITWYRADKDFAGDSLTTKVAVPTEGIITPIEGAASDTYIPTPEDVGKYIVAGIEPSSASGATTLYYSNAIYIDPVDVVLTNNISMITGEQMAYVFGDCRQIDPADPYIVPETPDEISFVPLRFVVEALGGTIGWNSESGEVTFTLNGSNCTLKIGADTMKVGDADYTLAAPTYILYDRTMFPAESLGGICGKYVYASDNGVILVGDYENTLNFDTDTELYDTIFKTIRRASYAQ